MDLLAIGKMGSSHGIAGYMKVASLSGETDHFFDLKEVVVRKGSLERILQIEEVKPFKREAVLIKFVDIDTPEKGKQYTNCELMVPREKCAPLFEGEHYISDLCNCLVKRDGEDVGRVVAVCNGGQSDLLEVELLSGKNVYIPFMHQYIGEVDTAEKTIELLTGFEIW